MDAVPSSSELAQLDLDRLPLFSKILNQVIHYEFSLWCTGKQAHEPTGESVYTTMLSHCGRPWIELYCGADAERTCAVFEKRLVHWLQDRLDGQRSSKQRKGLVARLKETWKMNSAPVFFVGQRVYARWTNDTGKLVPAVNREDRGERTDESL
jgi:hypothetical protein